MIDGGAERAIFDPKAAAPTPKSARQTPDMNICEKERAVWDLDCLAPCPNNFYGVIFL